MAEEEVFRDLETRATEGHLAADPVLDRNGELLPSRLRQEAAEGP